MILPELNPTSTILAIAVVALLGMNRNASKVHEQYREEITDQIDSLSILIKTKEARYEELRVEFLTQDSVTQVRYEDYKNSAPDASMDDFLIYADSAGYLEELCRYNPSLCK